MNLCIKAKKSIEYCNQTDIDKAMVLFELDRQLAGVSDNDMAIALNSKGYNVKYPDKRYFLKAAASVKAMFQ